MVQSAMARPDSLAGERDDAAACAMEAGGYWQQAVQHCCCCCCCSWPLGGEDFPAEVHGLQEALALKALMMMVIEDLLSTACEAVR